MPVEPNDAAKEIASYVFRHTKNYQRPLTEEHLAETIQEMIDNGQIYGGMVVTGDHDIGDRVVLDWSELGGRPKWRKIREMRRGNEDKV